MKQPIRIGLVGAGANTRAKHIPELRKIDGVEIVSVANRHRESSERVALRFSIPVVYDTWEELVRSPDSDAIVIGTWPYLHCEVTLAALAAGKHVLCEARMAMNATEAGRMLEEARRHPELVTQVVPSPFTLPVDHTVKRLVDEGYLGRLLAVEIHAKNGSFLDPQAPLHWRQDIDLSGVNVMSLGIWYEALMRWIGEVTSVQAHGNIFIDQRRDPETGRWKPVKIPDHIMVSAGMACGAQAIFLLSQVTGGVSVNEVLLFGSAATLRFRDGALAGLRKGGGEFTTIPIPAGEAGVWRVEDEFIRAIRGEGKITHTTFETGLKYMQFTDAVACSMAERRTVPVPCDPVYASKADHVRSEG